MSNTTKISPQDVCLIIEAAAKAGVKSLSFAGLTIELGQSPDVVEIVEQRDDARERDPKSPLTPEEKSELFDQMLIDDPMALEEQIMSGDDTEV